METKQMTSKHARAKFYANLRAVASNYQWYFISDSIRARLKDSRGNTAPWPLFCPLTAVHYAQKNERIPLPLYGQVAQSMNLQKEDTTMLAHSADKLGSKQNQQIRETLLRCVGLSTRKS